MFFCDDSDRCQDQGDAEQIDECGLAGEMGRVGGDEHGSELTVIKLLCRQAGDANGKKAA